MSGKRATLCVGTSGYQYDHWRGRFYPKDIPKRRWFDYYAQHFDAVEINNTFYNLPKPETFDAWRDAAPPGFRYILKYSRYGSHIKRLKDPEDHIATFCEVARRLESRLGPILVQLPPNWDLDLERLRAFLKATPRDLRWAVEIRDERWLCDEVYDALRENRAALCIHDLIDDHPREITADWTYWRFHGPENGEAYVKRYPHQAISAAARRFEEYLADGLDVYAFFNNDNNANAVENARELKRYIDR